MKKYLALLAQTHWVFAILALLFGLIYVFITPPLWGVDETSHFARVYQLAHGEVLPHVGRKDYGGKIPSNLASLDDYVKSDLLDNGGVGLFRKNVDSVSKYRSFESQHFAARKAGNLWTASYSPVAYVGAAIGVWVAGLLHGNIGMAIYSARIGSLLIYIALVTLGIYTLRDKKLKWLFFVLALCPVPLFQASVVTADNMAIGLSLLFVATLVAVLTSKEREVSKKLLIVLGVTAVLLPLVKINYIFLSLGILLLPGNLFGGRKKATTIKAVIISLSVVLGMVWTKIINGTANAPVSQRPDGLALNPTGQMHWIFLHPFHFAIVLARSLVNNADSYMHQLYTLIAWNYVTLPIIFLFGLLALSFLAAFYAKTEILPIKKSLIVLTVLALAGAVSIFVALYVAFNPVGFRVVDGVQGRYFIPLLAPILMLTTLLLPIEVKIREKFIPYIFTLGPVLCLIVSVIYYVSATYI